MSCKKFRVEIEETGRGAPLGAEAAAHLASCDSCRALRTGDERLRALVAGLARVEAPADFEFRLRARIARTEGVAPAFSLRRAFVPGAAWLAAAGCLVLALGLFVHFRQPQDQLRNQEIASGGSTAPTAAQQNNSAAREATTHDRNESSQALNDQSNEHSKQPSGGVLAATSNVTRTRTSGRAARVLRPERFVLSPDAVEQIAGAQPAANQPESHSLGVQGSPIIIGPPIPLPVTTQERRLEAMFKDMRGAQHVVAVDPVTFGARERTPQRASMKTVSATGIW